MILAQRIIWFRYENRISKFFKHWPRIANLTAAPHKKSTRKSSQRPSPGKKFLDHQFCLHICCRSSWTKTPHYRWVTLKMYPFAGFTKFLKINSTGDFSFCGKLYNLSINPLEKICMRLRVSNHWGDLIRIFVIIVVKIKIYRFREIFRTLNKALITSLIIFA